MTCVIVGALTAAALLVLAMIVLLVLGAMASLVLDRESGE